MEHLMHPIRGHHDRMSYRVQPGRSEWMDCFILLLYISQSSYNHFNSASLTSGICHLTWRSNTVYQDCHQCVEGSAGNLGRSSYRPETWWRVGLTGLRGGGLRWYALDVCKPIHILASLKPDLGSPIDLYVVVCSVIQSVKVEGMVDGASFLLLLPPLVVAFPHRLLTLCLLVMCR